MVMTATTFNELVRLEPRLGMLLADAAWHSRCARDFRGDVCANAMWYGEGGMRAKLQWLVGHSRLGPPQELQSEHAYDVAYQTIYRALPNCRHEPGYCWQGTPYQPPGRVLAVRAREARAREARARKCGAATRKPGAAALPVEQTPNRDLVAALEHASQRTQRLEEQLRNRE